MENTDVQRQRGEVDDAFDKGVWDGYESWLEPLPQSYYQPTPAAHWPPWMRGYWFGRILRMWLHGEGGVR